MINIRSREEILNDAKMLYEFHSEAAGAPVQADIILAAGSHDLRVPEYAARLFSEGVAPTVICSGGFGKITDGLWSVPEGDVFAERCIACGVPEDHILVEREAKNTGDNFSLSKKLCFNAGLYPQTGVIVCKPYMAKRAWATGSKQWPEVRWQVRVPEIPFEEYCTDDESLEREINLMTGDLQRLILYAEKGFQVPVDVPEHIWAAYERLADDGYDMFVIR
ncbi:MAG: YdcF family protein [Butyricicoccus sp.]|nr:YdcF family protein [Butyricicoccus sp.]